MTKLLIVDDEALVQIGMRSMVDYEALGIEVAGVAGNGQEAMEMIAALHPQIVITDIKMPIMDGLELIDRCNAELSPPPRFIVLTSFDEFAYARRALRANVVDYLIKIELDGDSLTAALQKALAMQEPPPAAEEPMGDMFSTRFLNQLLNYIFTDEESILQRAGQLGLSLTAGAYVAAAVELDFTIYEEQGRRESYSLYMAVLNMMEMALGKYAQGYIIAYSETVLGVLFCLPTEGERERVCVQALEHMGALSRKYFSIPLRAAVGPAIGSLAQLPHSFSLAQRLLGGAQPGQALLYEEAAAREAQPRLDMTELNRGIIKVLDSLDTDLYGMLIGRLGRSLREDAVSLEEGIDSISSIVHLIIYNLDHGRQILDDVFAGIPRSYRAIFNCQSRDELLLYLERLGSGMADALNQLKANPKGNLVRAAQSYIRQHLYERISLQDVARHIDVSPNYLSAIFKKYAGCGFNDYVTEQKMRTASQLLREGNLKVYQISEMLGFDSSYYFSTVYKKHTGMSPTETIALAGGAVGEPPGDREPSVK